MTEALPPAGGADTITRLNLALTGRYTITSLIARGGMASVYLADDLKHGRRVAIKVFAADVTSVIGPDRFLREIEVAARLNHPHILALHDSGRAGQFLYYVMPFVSGESLRQVLRRRGTLDVDAAVRIATNVAVALDHAHANGVVHLDIKPENVLMHEGEAVVMDFGIAGALNESDSEAVTGARLVAGTPGYMSPEQAAGRRDLDARSDIYSLGCVLYELLTGQPPAGPFGLPDAARRWHAEAPTGIRGSRPDVPIHVEQALSRALALAASDRFESGAEFAAALRPAAGVARQAAAVAVLPFLNMSADAENEYFADGITEDVIAHLSNLPSLKVIARASVMRFKARPAGLSAIAGQLGASVLVDGSVRRAGNRVRIVAQLVDASSEAPLWTETYDRELTDIFAIQTDVALHIATALDAELSADERRRLRQPQTTDVDAYQLYLQGRHCVVRFTAEGVLRGVEYFERAIALDPKYALAHAGIALGYLSLGETGGMRPLDAYRRAQGAVTAALSFDPNLGDAHAMLGMLVMLCDFDWAGAERAFRRAIELSPSSADAHDFYARLCSAQERFDEALALGHRANELDPLAHRSDYSTTLLRAGRYAEALERAARVVEFDPHYDRAHATLGWAYLRNNRPAEGLASLQRAVELSPDNLAWLAQLGEAYGETGDVENAREVLARLAAAAEAGYVSPYYWAYVHTGLGDFDAALDWLDEAFVEKAGAVYGIKGSFLFAPLRTHPRFITLLRKMRLA